MVFCSPLKAMLLEENRITESFSIFNANACHECRLADVLTNISMHYRLRRHKTGASFKILQNRVNESFNILLEIQRLNRHF